MIKFPETPYFTVDRGTNNYTFTSVILDGGCEVFIPVLNREVVDNVKEELVSFANMQREALTPEPELA